jgi:hypothetical protein
MNYMSALFRNLAFISVFSLPAVVMSATPITESTPKSVPAGKATGKKPLSSAVVDAGKCPEKTPGGGAGDLAGGMCLYPMPEGGVCWDGCNKTQDQPPKCRCSQATPPSGGKDGQPAQTQAPKK